MKNTISLKDFTKVDIRVGTVIGVHKFPKARRPAYQLIIDFGDLGIKKTSAQITKLYTKETLLNKQVLAVVNMPTKQIANFMSECLVLGAVNVSNVILLTPAETVSNGAIVS